MVKKILISLFAFFALSCADSSMRFIFYHEPTFVTEYTTLDFFTILNHPGFHRNRQTVMFHYAQDQTITTPQVHDLVSAYATNGQFNYILVHYTDPRIIQNSDAADLAEAIAITLTNFFNNGYSSGQMNLIGFSLGAQIMDW
ncbi:hypothetical protein PVAND_015946 [Polypedilum vanderplanki]|uniref:Uncharacterized protein n=1 Tax=Polypedilum vanderplanki TaxID=319348 RepID=A0A9J6BE24_POLVA|nr:hypothetical protein PVAND_015946 [Polypedilum vanderplanki]